MADQELKVIISSDTADALKGITQVNTATKDLGKTTVTTAAQVTTSFNKISSSSKQLQTANKDLSKSVVNANGSLVSFTRIVQDAPFGIIGVGNNITQFTEQFAALRAQTGSTGAALSAFGSSILGPAGLLTLGISAGISLWTLYAQSQQKAASEAKKVAEENKSLAQVLRETESSVQGQVQSAKDLGAILLDTNKSYDARKSALNELQKLNKGYFGDLSLEKSSYEQIKGAVDKYADSLVRAATIKGLQEQISKTAEELSKISPIFSKALRDLGKQQDPFAEFAKDTAKNAAAGNVQLQGAFTRLDSILNSSGKKLASDVANVGRIQQQAISAVSPTEELKKRLKGFTDALANALSGTDTPDTGATKNIKTISDVIKELNKDLLGLDASFAAAGGSLRDLSEDKIRAITSALKDLSAFGVLPGSTLFDSLQKQIAVLQTTLTRTPVVLKVPISIETIQPASNANTIRAVLEGVKQDFTNVNAVIVDQGKAMAGLFASVGEGLSTAIANVLTGKSTLVQALGSLLGIMGDFITQFGKTLIEAATLRIIAEKTLLANPYAALAAGIGAVIIGQTLKNFTPSFATGGTVFGPTLAMIGDNPGREEHIIPSEVLDKLGGGNWGDFVLTGTLRGTDIVIAAKRASNNQLRING